MPFSTYRHRRTLLKGLLVGSTTLAAGPLLTSCATFGRSPRGFVEIQGEVRLDGRLVKEGTAWDGAGKLSTGPRARAILVAGDDAFLLHELTEIEFPARSVASVSLISTAQADAISTIYLVRGKLLAVFRPGDERRLMTPVASIGIRGTGLYLETNAEKSYLCTCYGTIDLESRTDPNVRESLTTQHHEAPRFLYRGIDKESARLEKAPMLGHTDEELLRLEAAVGRKPPFAHSSY
ncbi:MAG: hypothetical protein HQL57_10600 [Magnetococcales bacterium]|nr:hypothetical protein [Magnetococcales bacterium]MBF0157622.1 hypothetical protein [Magnetococcales bacterium]